MIHATLMLATACLVISYGMSLPQWLHAGIIGASAAFASLVAPAAFRILDKLSQIQRESEAIGQAARTNGIYDYVHVAKVELAIFLFIASVAGIVNGGIAFVLAAKDSGITALGIARLVGLGYAALVFILLFAARVVRLFLHVDLFRKRLFNVVNAEKDRVAAVRAMTPSALTPFPAGEPRRKKRRLPT